LPNCSHPTVVRGRTAQSLIICIEGKVPGKQGTPDAMFTNGQILTLRPSIIVAGSLLMAQSVDAQFDI